MSIRRAFTAPARLLRYLSAQPGGSYRERFEALPPEKERLREQSWKRNGFFLAFVNTRGPGRRR